MILPKAAFFQSPHFNERPLGAEVELLVIHNISLPPAEFENDYIRDFFLGQLDATVHPYFETIKTLKVSSHFLIKRDGHVLQFVDCDKRAWHAGVSCWQGRENCNDFSIGIELEGTDELPYTDEQYDSLVSLTHELIRYYPKLTEQNIVGHSDIAPGRKTDPGPSFDWSRYKTLLTALNVG